MGKQVVIAIEIHLRLQIIFHSNHEYWLILLGAFYENNVGSDQNSYNCFNRTFMHFHLLPISM